MAAALRVFLPGLALLVATRAVLATSDRFFADGDEAVVGLMAKHLLERGEVSLFYWGQAYGVVFFEAAAAAVAFVLGGISGVTLKLGALAIFAGGWVAFVAAARRLAGDRAATNAGLLLASAPAWFAFSAKAWGGFVTSFALASVALLSFSAPPDRSRRARAAAAGGLAALTLFSQPVCAVAFAPLFLADEIRPRRRGEWAALVTGALAVGVALFAAARPGDVYWAPTLFRAFGGADVASASLPALGRVLFVMSTGCHFMNTALPAPPLARVAAVLALVTLVTLLVAAATRVVRTRSFPLDAACATSTLAVLGVALAIRPERLMFRYLVPLIAPLTLGVAILTRSRRDARLATAAGVVWVVAGASCIRHAVSSIPAGRCANAPFRRWSDAERAGVHAVYTTHPCGGASCSRPRANPRALDASSRSQTGIPARSTCARRRR